MFGVCRPGSVSNLNEDDADFYDGDDTWLMEQYNRTVENDKLHPTEWHMYCNTCEGAGMTLDPLPQMPEGSRIGLLLDFDNGGTLTMYLKNKPCGTIAEGLVGPLLPCIASYYPEKTVKIHGGLTPPPPPPQPTITNWVFGSIPAAGDYTLSGGGAVVTKVQSSYRGVVSDGPGCTPMTSGVHYWELEMVNSDGLRSEGGDGTDGSWYFGVCRPEIDLNDGSKTFYNRDDTWLMRQYNAPVWDLRCNSLEGTGMTLDPEPLLSDGSRIGLLMDFDNGGTLTMYWKNKPCGTIAEGLVGPLLPCISSRDADKVVKIHGGLAPPL